MIVCVWTYLEVTRSVDEQVWGLEVTVQHISGVNVLEAAQDLIQEVADMVIAQPLALQQLVQVCLHQSLHDVAEGRRGQGQQQQQSWGKEKPKDCSYISWALYSNKSSWIKLKAAESNFVCHLHNFV